MLIELRISRLALVEEIVVPLGPGLTVLTGETGAGKSLIAGALALLCGRHAPKELVREGEELAYVEGVFDLSAEPDHQRVMSRLGVRVGADGILVLRRELRRQGRGRVLINGLVSSLALLEQIGPRLLCIQSQDQQRELADAGFARDLLDSQLGCGPLREDLRAALADYRDLAAVLAERRREEEAAQQQMEMWSYQYEELRRADLRADEEQQLKEDLTIMRHAGALQEGSALALQHLAEGENSARERLGAAMASLHSLADKSQKLHGIYDTLTFAEEQLAEATAALNRFLDAMDLDAVELEELEARKALYEELRRKYRQDAAGLIAMRDSLQLRISRHDAASADLDEYAQRLETARLKLEKAAGKLHRKRVSGAAEISAAAEACIRPLALPALELQFKVQLMADPQGAVTIEGGACHVGADGPDRIELHIRTNPGERMGPAGPIASGGERSRIHLGLTALQRIESERPLLLFDEIDAGLGMDAARPVARLLRELATDGQVLCITHLPTMAVHCDAHLKVEKHTARGRTLLRVVPLTAQEKVDEVARLLGGEGWGEGDQVAQRSYAIELLHQGERERLAVAENGG
jgi:DNA repair protein RecN (Recombination protein N)